MIKFKFFNNFNKKKFALIALLILALLFILGNYNREIIKSYIDEVVKSPSTRIHLINIAKVAIPLKNHILMRNVDDKIALLKSSGSCVFCDLNQGDFKGNDLKGADLRYATLIGANLSNTNLSNADLSNANLSNANLSNTNLIGTLLIKANLSGANLSNTNLSNANLSLTNLSNANLSNANLTSVNLGSVNLSGANLDGVDLRNEDLTKINLSGVDLRNKDLTGVNLSGVDLRNIDLTGTILIQANLSGANLDGVDLRNKDLTGVNLSGVNLSNTDLTETILKDSQKIEIRIKNSGNKNWAKFENQAQWPVLENQAQRFRERAGRNLHVTRYDLSGDVQYLATKEGLLFESKNNESRLVLNLRNDSLFPFIDQTPGMIDLGLLGVASQNKLVYVAYTSPESEGVYSLVVDEYSMNFTKVRNIIKIGGFTMLFGGNLSFDSHGKLYLSVGDGNREPAEDKAQNLNSLRGKILRLDVSKSKLEPEIIAYGVRNPWGVTIDSKDRMFIMQCGRGTVEAVYLLNDLYSGIPANFGWPVFEGQHKRMKKDPLMINDILDPIFEYHTKPICATAGVYLDDIELLMLGDFYGTIRLLKQQENGEWNVYHEYKQEEVIWSFGLDEKTKKIFVAPKNLELEILFEQVKLNL
jgi:uncharacterized protein YjbI with pentapeptide repeats